MSAAGQKNRKELSKQEANSFAFKLLPILLLTCFSELLSMQ
jgi:hypothetical protein